MPLYLGQDAAVLFFDDSIPLISLRATHPTD